LVPQTLYPWLAGVLVFGSFCIVSIYVWSRYTGQLQHWLRQAKMYLAPEARAYTSALALSLCLVVLGGVSIWLYYYMFGYTLNIFLVIGLYAVVQLVELIPISINGIGVREGMLVLLFMTAGVPGEVSIGVALLARLVLLLQTAVGGIVYVYRARLLK
jgi:uncharacterized protein (TIRG00374 family)